MRQAKYIILISIITLSNASHADSYSNYYQRATRLIIPEANAQITPVEELPKPLPEKNYIVPELKTDNKAVLVPPISHAQNKSHTNNRRKPELSLKAKKALMMAEIGIKSDTYANAGQDGIVRYQYGAGQADLVCAPLKACAIMLDNDEVVSDMHIGDMSWQPNAPIAGKTNAVVVKPISANIHNTNLLIFTDKRQYSINLIAHQSRYMPMIAFTYTDTLNSSNQKILAFNRTKISQQQKEKNVNNAKYALNAEKLDYNYEVSGNAPFRIERISTDGIKTYIDLKKSTIGNELPIFIAMTSGKEQQVNYKYDTENHRYIIDKKIKNGLLLAGEDRLIISYNGAK